MDAPSDFVAWVKDRKGNPVQVHRVARDYYVDGKRKWVSAQGKNYREAWARFDVLWEKHLIRSGQLSPDKASHGGGSTSRPRTDGMTVDALIDEWWPIKKTDGAQGQTLARYESSIRLHIRPALGGRFVGEVAEADIREFIHETLPAKRRQKKDGSEVPALGGSPIRKIALLTNEIFEFALRRRYITENPCQWVKTPLYRPVANERVSELTSLPGDLLPWMGAAERGYWVLAFLGLRQSERLGVGWSSFQDLEDREKPCYLTVDRQISYRPDIKGPDGKGTVTVKRQVKSDAGERKFAISEEVRELILQWKAAQDQWRMSPRWRLSPDAAIRDLVYTNSEGRPIKPQTDLKLWDRMFAAVSADRVEEGEEPVERVRPHLMRHIAATILAEKQVPPRHAMKILGHSKEAMTAYYTHLNARETASSINSLTSALFPNEQGGPEMEVWNFERADLHEVPFDPDDYKVAGDLVVRVKDEAGTTDGWAEKMADLYDVPFDPEGKGNEGEDWVFTDDETDTENLGG